MGVVIRTEQLTKRYGPFTALDALDLEVVEGEALGYLGPNGAGKSTTLALLLGLIRPTSGRASIYGLDPWGDAPELHRRLAYVPSEANAKWPAQSPRSPPPVPCTPAPRSGKQLCAGSPGMPACRPTMTIS